MYADQLQQSVDKVSFVSVQSQPVHTNNNCNKVLIRLALSVFSLSGLAVHTNNNCNKVLIRLALSVSQS